MNTETYKGYVIELDGFGYYEATNTSDCDAPVIVAKTIAGVVAEIDELGL